MSGTFMGMPAFPKAARDAVRDTTLRGNLRHATHTIRAKRAAAVAELEDWPQLREAGKRRALGPRSLFRSLLGVRSVAGQVLLLQLVLVLLLVMGRWSATVCMPQRRWGACAPRCTTSPHWTCQRTNSLHA